MRLKTIILTTAIITLLASTVTAKNAEREIGIREIFDHTNLTLIISDLRPDCQKLKNWATKICDFAIAGSRDYEDRSDCDFLNLEPGFFRDNSALFTEGLIGVENADYTTSWCSLSNDSDHDGVNNGYDFCPEGIDIEANRGMSGCEEEEELHEEVIADLDHDGTPNGDELIDECWDLPGPPEEPYRGCPEDFFNDRDEDGIADFEDDSDGDGISDYFDSCWEDPTNTCGDDEIFPSDFGDGDGDGVLNSDDECIDRPGPAAFAGCPDYDGDGTPHLDDPCPWDPEDKCEDATINKDNFEYYTEEDAVESETTRVLDINTNGSASNTDSGGSCSLTNFSPASVVSSIVLLVFALLPLVVRKKLR